MAWREEDHPRDPEGVATGGRFTSKSRGGKTKGLSDAKKAAWQRVGKVEYRPVFVEDAAGALWDEDTEIDEFEAKQLVEDRFNGNFSGRARDFFSSAIWDDEPATLIVDNEGEVRAFFTGSVEPGMEYAELGDTTYWLDYIGVADKSMGWGPVAFVAALREAVQEAAWQDEVLDTIALNSANGHSNKFYEAMGMHSLGYSGLYYLKISEVKAILKAVGD